MEKGISDKERAYIQKVANRNQRRRTDTFIPSRARSITLFNHIKPLMFLTLLVTTVGLTLLRPWSLTYGDAVHQDLRFSVPVSFIIPIIQELHANFTDLENALEPNPSALKQVHTDSLEMTRLKIRYDNTQKELRWAKKEKSALIRSLSKVEDNFSTVDFDGIYDPVVLWSEPQHTFAINNSKQYSGQLNERFDNLQISLDSISTDIEDAGKAYEKNIAGFFAHWSTVKMMRFLADEPLHEISRAQQAVLNLHLMKLQIFRAMQIVAIIRFESIGLDRDLQEIEATLNWYGERKNELPGPEARVDVQLAAMLIGYHNRSNPTQRSQIKTP